MGLSVEQGTGSPFPESHSGATDTGLLPMVVQSA